MATCSTCGQIYGVLHSCPGQRLTPAAQAAAWPVPTGFAPFHYFRHAIAIARLDDGAIISASLDKNSMAYGAGIWLLGQFLVFGHVIWAMASGKHEHRLAAVIIGFFVLVIVDALWLLAQYGLVHLLARALFGARGTYVGVLRPLLLGSIVTWLLVIPYVGRIVGGIWAIAIMMVVFEDADGIGKLQAFGLSFVIGVLFLGVFRSFLKLG